MGTWSEFQQLKEVIVGRVHESNSFDWHPDEETRETLNRILRESNEDLDNLCEILKNEGVVVKRPENVLKLEPEKELYTQNLKFRYPNHPLMPRDIFGFFGKNIVSTYAIHDSRFLESLAYYDIAFEYWQRGFKWNSMPVPPINSNNQKDYQKYQDNNILIFDTANLIKCGKDIFYSQTAQSDPKKGKGTDFGLEWVKQQLPEFTFNEINVGGHADGKIALLKPGLLMTWNKDWIPEKLKSWDVIIADDKSNFPEDFINTRKQRFYTQYVQQWLTNWIGYADESVFDVNVLSISEDKVIVTGNDPDTLKKIESYGITPIYWKWRHQYFWDGGIHCCTQDTIREGSQEDYF